MVSDDESVSTGVERHLRELEGDAVGKTDTPEMERHRANVLKFHVFQRFATCGVEHQLGDPQSIEQCLGT